MNFQESFDSTEQEKIQIIDKSKAKPKKKIAKTKSLKAKKQDKIKKDIEIEPDTISITTAKGIINHQRPRFLKRWDGQSNYLQITEQEYKKMPPMMHNYWKQKSSFMRGVIFVQIGKMEYYVFENDAILLHELFGKQISKFSKFLSVHIWQTQVIPLSNKLFKKNIAIKYMQEVNDPKYKQQNKINRRQVKRILNPAIYIDYQVEQKQTSQRFLLSLYPNSQYTKIGIVVIDTSTNIAYLQQIEQDDLRRILNKFKPVQIVTLKNSQKTMKKTIKQICGNALVIELAIQPNEIQNILTIMNSFNGSEAFSILLKRWNEDKQDQNFREQNFYYFNCICAIDLLSEYFKKLHVLQRIFPTTIFQLTNISTLNIKPVFDSQIYQNLEVFDIRNQQDSFGQKGTLYAYLNQCKTESGQRKLRQWLSSPLTDIKKIQRRQQCLLELIQNHDIIKKFHDQLKQIPDFQTKIASIYHWLIQNPQDFKIYISRVKEYNQDKNPIVIRIKQIKLLLEQIQAVSKLFTTLFNNFEFKSQYLKELTKELLQSNKYSDNKDENHNFLELISLTCSQILMKINMSQDTGKIIPDIGIVPEYDQQLLRVQSLNNQLQSILQSYKIKLNCNNLKYVSKKARNQIEIPNSFQVAKDTKSWLHFSSSTVKVNRYTTLDTQSITQQLVQHEKQMDLALIPFLNIIVSTFTQHKFDWNRFCEMISDMDVICALASVSNQMQIKCVPQFVQKGLQYQEAIHVGLQQVKKNVVRNSMKFQENQTLFLITGPNMGGKSTILRQTCLLAIIAQIGCLVPAKIYRGKVFDQIFCRIGASDNINQGKSTFFIQMQQTKHITSKSTKDSLVVIDELGRGTSTYDGVAIAGGVLKQLISIQCLTLFSTHYSVLAQQFKQCCEIRNKTLDYQISDEKLEFKYQLIDGVAQKSFAFNVGRIVELPQLVLNMAEQKSKMLQKEEEIQKINRRLDNLLQMLEI